MHFPQLIATRILLVLGILLLGANATPQIAGAQTTTPTPVRLQGHVLRILSRATKLPRDPRAGNQSMTLTIMLNFSDPAGFQAFLQGRDDPHSRTFQQVLTASQLTARFGPTQQVYDAVLAWLRRSGFTLVDGSADRLTLTVRGARSQVESVFGLNMNDYRLGSHTFYANDRDPAVPAALAPFVRSVSGLSNLAQPHPHASPAPSTPQSIEAAYDAGKLPPGVNGSGTVIGLLEYDNFARSDVSNWLRFVGLPQTMMNQLSTVDVNGGTGVSGGLGTTEVLGDIDTVMGMAPAARYVVFDAPQGTSDLHVINSAINGIRAMTGGQGGIISLSWGWCESEVSDSEVDSMEGLVQAGVASGFSFFFASGDNGSTCTDSQGAWANRVGFPSDVPHAVAVGGTNLQVGVGNSYQSESWWNSTSGKGGYGISWHFARPAYQSPFTAASGRSVPDVSADADPNTGIAICQAGRCGMSFGGTSMAAPIWAAAWALAVQGAGWAPRAPLDPAYLYSLADSGIFHRAGSMTGPNDDFAHLGLGSPDIARLAARMAGRPQVQSVTPDTSPVTDPAALTITGRHFIDVQRVWFVGRLGVATGAPAPSFTVTSVGQIVAQPPALPAGSYDVEVTTSAGQSETGSGDIFTVLPVVTAIKPASGPFQGGTSVMLVGQGFASSAGDQTVYFGNSPSPNVSCPTDSECLAASPAHAPGTVDLTVSVQGVRSRPGPGDQFTYQGPSITRVSPSIGPETGGTYVDLFGSGFAQGMSVRFGGTPSDYAVCESSTWCKTRSPAGTGTVDITVTVDGLTSETSSADQFTYRSFPAVTGLSPTAGPATGGTAVIITGANFSTVPGATSVRFGANVAARVTCSSTTQCTAISPPGSVTADVTVTVNGLTSVVTPTDRFTYVPVVTGIKPASGPQTGGTTVTITGSGFNSTAALLSVSFGSSVATHVSCSSTAQCTALSPAGSGTVDVLVTVEGLTSARSAADRFIYQAPSLAGWTQWFPTSSPSGRGAALAYDSVHRQVLYVGSGGPGTLGETWTWNGGSAWTQLDVDGPPSVLGEGLAFDDATGSAVLFGGLGYRHAGTRIYPQLSARTWIWNDSQWTETNPAIHPPARFNASTAYDAAHKRIVLFGGCASTDCTSMRGDTWTWDGRSWTQQSMPTAPSPRSGASMTYDPVTRTVVLFGGVDGAKHSLGDTWVWNGITWIQQHPATSPSARSSAALACHPVVGGLLLFGGTGQSSYPRDTWAWNGSTWRRVPATTSPSTSSPNMTYDAALNLDVLFGRDRSTWTWGGVK